jgi:poly-gamma-glutamate capsule biosynthesis protein CapA/YwtB (metallophosphatase superfamily)
MEREKFLLGLAGDVMIGRGVDQAIAQKGYDYPWGDVLPLLRSTDMNLANLETALTYSNTPVPKTFNFKASPDKVQTLNRARITAVSLANNHVLDFEEGGLLETLRTLKAAGIHYAGAGTNETEAARPALITRNGFSLGLLSFTDNEPGWKAGPYTSGTNYINVEDSRDRQRVLNAVELLRPAVDLVVVSLHWGPNMREEPPAHFITFAHQLVEGGADIIHGHSAHLFQGIEIYRHKLILYDTGDFVDDYMVHPAVRNDLSFLFLVELVGNHLERLRLVPVRIANNCVNKATGPDARWAFRLLQERSALFGTVISEHGEVPMALENAP